MERASRKKGRERFRAAATPLQGKKGSTGQLLPPGDHCDHFFSPRSILIELCSLASGSFTS